MTTPLSASCYFLFHPLSPTTTGCLLLPRLWFVKGGSRAKRKGKEIQRGKERKPRESSISFKVKANPAFIIHTVIRASETFLERLFQGKGCVWKERKRWLWEDWKEVDAGWFGHPLWQSLTVVSAQEVLSSFDACGFDLFIEAVASLIRIDSLFLKYFY